MKPHYNARTEAQGQIAHLTLRWLAIKRNCRKPKLFGYIGSYYKFPADKKALWVNADFWRLK